MTLTPAKFFGRRNLRVGDDVARATRDTRRAASLRFQIRLIGPIEHQ